jgi:predicted amino acid-binding ACT domain protein
MSETIKVAQYFYLDAPDRPGEAARLLGVLRDEGVNLLALSGFPAGRRSQVDLVPEDPARLRTVARRQRWKLTGPKKVLLISGEDRVGAMVGVAEKLAAAKINIVATQAVATGPGVFGAILWVAPRDVARATKVLGAA